LALFVVAAAVFYLLAGGITFGSADSWMIIEKVRLPRVFAAMVTGAALAASGCVFQAVLRNPLADPFTLGVSGGAAFGASVFFVSGVAAVSALFAPVFAFAGALLAVLCVYFLSARKKFDSYSMILSGVIISYIFSSAVMIVYALSSADQMQSAIMWLMGSFSFIDERILPASAAVAILGTVILYFYGNVINVISLGQNKSNSLGINTERSVKILFITASLITASVVAICGVIGFVGLMAPHIMRRFTGANNKTLIAASAMFGAGFLPLCDAISRIIFAPVIIPVGVITSVIGGVFFIALLLKSGNYDRV